MDSRVNHLLVSLHEACVRLDNSKPETKAEVIDILVDAESNLWSIIDAGAE